MYNECFFKPKSKGGNYAVTKISLLMYYFPLINNTTQEKTKGGNYAVTKIS